MKYYFKCPRCGNDDGFTRTEQQSSGMGCLILLFGGLISALLHAGSQMHRIQCDRCGYIFRQPALPWNGAARLAEIVLLAFFLASVALAVLVTFPDISAGVVWPRIVEYYARHVEDQAPAFVVVVGVAGVVTVVSCLVALVVSPLVQRRKMSREFELRVKRRPGEADGGDSPARDAASE